MMFWNGSWSWGNWVAMALLMVVFWTLLVGAAVMVVRALRRPRQATPGADAREVLDRRLAQGEITEEEYSHRRELLNTSPRV